jgi:transaldolase
LAAAIELSKRAARPNVFIKIPGTTEGLSAIEDSIFAGIPINVTLLFSTEQYLAAAEAYMRGVERRIEKGLTPYVASVASLFVSRWDVAVAGKVPEALINHLGIAVGKQAYKAYCDLLASERNRRIMNAGGRAQRLLLASTGTKDPNASTTLYVEALAAPYTVDTMPEATLKAFAERGNVGAPTPADGGDAVTVLKAFAGAGIDLKALATKLQDDGAASFVKSWTNLMEVIGSKSAALAGTA